MKHNLKHLSLNEIAGGEVDERFEQALGDVLENILDLNTSDVARSITIKLKFKPQKNERGMLNISADVKASLAPRLGASTQLYVGMENDGNIEASELYKGQVRGQISVEDVVSENDNLFPIQSVK